MSMMWEKVRLSEIVDTSSGGTPNRSIKEYWENGDIPWIKSGQLKDCLIDGAEEFITEKGLKSSSAKLVDKGTLLLALYGATAGKLGFLGLNATTNQAICAIKPKKENLINTKYLYYYLLSQRSEIIKDSEGGAQPNISQNYVNNIQIPLPPLPIQKRIAEILDTADALRRKDEALLKKYDELAQAIFIDMFGDPVKNEKGWEVKKLGELTNISSGSTPDRKKPEYYLGNIPWVKTTEVRGEIINNTDENISEDALKNSSCKLHPKGSVIVAMYGQGKTRGQVGLLGIDATTNQACGVIKPNNSFNSIYLFNYLKNSYNELRKLGRGGNQENLNAGMLKDFEIMYPPLELQTKFESIITLFNTQISLINGEQSPHLFNSLLQKAFNGELVA